MRTLSFALRLALLSAVASLASAQVNKSNLTGVVKDTSGSVVPGAALKLVNSGTGATRQEQSNGTGFYRFTLLDFGVYRLEVEQPGFKKFLRSGIELQTGETATVDVNLEVGQLSDAITITGEAPLLRTETGAIGATVDKQTLDTLPMIGRNPYVLIQLSPGIQYTGSPSSLNPWDSGGPSQFASSGSEARSEFLLDGIPNMSRDRVAYNPSPDAVQEMRVQTNAYDAEYGHSGAAFVNVSTRAGDNDYHGSAYWYLRNDNLNANSFFNNLNGTRKSEYKLNTYGAAFSGPARLPRVYDGRDRTHFHFDFEGTRQPSGSVARAIVPTALERAGDFSRTVDRSGNPYLIYDPLTTRPSGSGYVRSPFPGNAVPTARIDPVAANVMKYYPQPTRTPTANMLENFENPAMRSTFRWASLASRVDHQINSSHTLFARYGWNHRHNFTDLFYAPGGEMAGHPNSEEIYRRGNISAALGHTWIRSARSVWDVRLGFSRYFDGNDLRSVGFDIAQLGFPASFARSVVFAVFPRFEMGGDMTAMGPNKNFNPNFLTQYNLLINNHYNVGRHSLKGGFRYQVLQDNQLNPLRAGGLFTFGRGFTQGPDPTRTAATSGHGFAGFLLGTPTSAYVDSNIYPARQNTYFAFYVQDDWKVTNRLTLNAGLRLEHEGPVTERFNRGNAGYDFSVASPVEQQARANYAKNSIPELAQLNAKGGLRFLATGGMPRGNLSMQKVLYAPRFGYAYRISDRLVWRGGWGIFFNPNFVSNFRQDGFSVATQMVTSLDNNLTPFNTLKSPFPSGLSSPPGASAGLLTLLGQSVTAGAVSGSAPPAYLNGISQQFSMGFQAILPASVSLEASYVGSVSQRLSISRNANQYANEFLALKTRLNARVPNPFYGVITDPTTALSQSTTTVTQLLRPFPHFTGLTLSGLPYGRSHYDSLQLQVSRRMSHGLRFGAAYTLSKLMESTSYLNANDPKPASVISDSDRPQRLALYGVWELPFGRFAPRHAVGRRLIGGWQISWMTTFQSGEALAFSGAERTRRSGNDPHRIDQWFDVAQFVPQEPFTLRALSARVADLRGPGIKKWDFTLLKNVPIREKLSFRFQVEAYNAFNTTHLDLPNTAVTSRSFGWITGTSLGPRNIQLAARLLF